MRPQVGDIVQVNRDEAAMTLALRTKVIHVPAAEGDLWGFENPSGAIWWTNERMTVFLLEKAP